MKSMPSILILLALAVSTHCLQFSLSAHLQTADQQAYLNQLLQIQNTLKSQILELEQIVTTVNSNISSLQGYPNIQAQTIEIGLDDQRRRLYTISSQLNLPYKMKTWDCNQLTPTYVSKINQQISDTQNYIQLLKAKMASQPACERNNQINLQIQYLSMYVNQLASQVSSNCVATTTPITPTTPTTNTTTNNTTTVPTTPKTVLVPNSLNTYYIYGSQTQASYNTNLQSLLQQGYTKLQCPVAAPYPKGNQCVTCPQDGTSYYDLTKLLCMTCPAGYKFVPLDHTCQIVKFNSNSQGLNFIGPFPTAVAGLETCPIGMPFWNGTMCVGCPVLAFFDFNQKSCQSCPAGTTFNTATHLCQYQKYNSNINANSTNYCCGTLPHDANINSCPESLPFFNGQKCIGCGLPAYFSLQSMTCTLCPQGQGFSLVQRKCIDSKYLQVYYTSGISQTVQNFQGTPPQPQPTYEKVTACPADHPFFNGQQCISCPLPSFFNFQDNLCHICPGQTHFDTTTKKCVQFTTQQMNNNMVVITNYMGAIPNFNNQLATCPTDYPFFDGNKCVACALPNYIDFSTLTCRACNTGFQFSTFNRQCIITTPTAYTSLSSPNLFYNGDFSSLQSQLAKLKSQYPSLQECPASTQYYDYTQGKCISCPSQYPLFDYKYNRCIACSGESTYDAASRICVLQGQVSPTIQRMIMNTIGWV